jgi:hypothetical protein
MNGQILMEDDMTSQELLVSASIARDRRPLPAKSRCTAHLLIPGDVVAIYAGDRYDHAATVERAVDVYAFTPPGHVTLWTTSGRYDVPSDARLDVMAWAPLAR